MKNYRIEIPAVRQSSDKLSERLERFANRYRKIIAKGQGVCLTDNAMGKLAFQGPELIENLGLPVPPKKIMAHINTFHTIKELHNLMDGCARLGIDAVLVVSGDGSIRLPRLKPQDLNVHNVSAVTSVELLGYLRQAYGSTFRYGVAFNQYEPRQHELDKLNRKLSAGAEFIITQPVLEASPIIDELSRIPDVTLFIEAWMSSNIKLLSECVGYALADNTEFDPLTTLRGLETAYPEAGLYLALVDFKTQFDRLGGPEEGTPT